MVMIALSVWLAVAYGTFLIGWAEITARPRDWLMKKSGWFERLVDSECSYCMAVSSSLICLAVFELAAAVGADSLAVPLIVWAGAPMAGGLLVAAAISMELR